MIASKLQAGKVLILVPKSNKIAGQLGIAVGSGIVARFYGDGLADVYFEGNLYNAANIKTFEDRAYHAWDRMRVGYPTIARTRLKMDCFDDFFHVVGEVVDNTAMSIHRCARTLVDVWCGKPAGHPVSRWINLLKGAMTSVFRMVCAQDPLLAGQVFGLLKLATALLGTRLQKS